MEEISPAQNFKHFTFPCTHPFSSVFDANFQDYDRFKN